MSNDNTPSWIIKSLINGYYGVLGYKKKKLFSIPIIIALFFLSACGNSGKKTDTKSPRSYSVIAMERRSATLRRDFPTLLQGEQDIEIRPKIEGYIEKIYVDEGAEVKKNQLLFQITAPQYEQEVRTAAAAISSAQAEVRTAQLQIDNTRRLVQKDIVSQYELKLVENTLETKQAMLEKAKAELVNAKSNMGYTVIISPVNGVVGAIPYRIGSLVNGNNPKPLTTVSNIQNMHAYFSLNEKQLLEFYRMIPGKTLNEKIKKMPLVELLLPDGTVYPKKGRIETISGIVNTETGSVSFRATFPNPTGLLRSGSSGIIRIPNTMDSVILIPQRSTFELQGKHFVYLVNKRDTVKSTEIKIMDLPAGQYYVVTDGLQVGDQLIYDGGASLKDGMRVQPKKLQHDYYNQNSN